MADNGPSPKGGAREQGLLSPQYPKQHVINYFISDFNANALYDLLQCIYIQCHLFRKYDSYSSSKCTV